MSAARRYRLLRDEVVRLLHETGLTTGALARLKWATARHPEGMRELAAHADAAHLLQRRWSAIVAMLDELWHTEAAVGRGTPDSYIVRFRGSGSDSISRANAIQRILQRVPAQHGGPARFRPQRQAAMRAQSDAPTG